MSNPLPLPADAPNKWEVKSHSYQIGDTGDYDGWHELTNGNISLGTKDDDEETIEVLNALAGHLNAWDIELFDAKADNLAIDVHCLQDEIKIREQEWKVKYDELKADYSQYVKDFEQLFDAHAALQQQHQELRAENNSLLVSLSKTLQTLDTYKGALTDIAKQHKSTEWEDEGDTEHGYDCIIDVARKALQAWKEGEKEGQP